MGKTIIRVACIDQKLVLTSDPGIASGGRNEDVVEFEFCSLWSGFAKTAVFYRTPDEVYHVPATGNSCVIPHEVLADEGLMYFGVFGVKGDTTRTSEILKYRVAKGALIPGSEPSDPAPNIYEQIMEHVGEIDNRTTALEAGLNKPEVYTITGGAIQLDNFEDMPMDCVVQGGSGASVGLTRCGRNLLGGTVTERDGCTEITLDCPLPPGTYTVSGRVTSSDVNEGSSLFAFRSPSNDAMVGYCSFKRTGAVESYRVTITDYAERVRMHASTNLTTSAGLTAEWSEVQVEVSPTRTEYEPYQGDTYTVLPGDKITIPALAGVNTLYTNGDSLTVSGRKDVFWLTHNLVERIKALEEIVTTMSTANERS